MTPTGAAADGLGPDDDRTPTDHDLPSAVADHRAHTGGPGRRLVRNRPPSLPPAGGFTSLSCISEVFCLAAGGGANEADAADSTGPGVVASWDGATWSTPAIYFAASADGPDAGAVDAGHLVHRRAAVRGGRRLGPRHVSATAPTGRPRRRWPPPR